MKQITSCLLMWFLLLFFISLSACDYGRMWETPAVKPLEEPPLEAHEDTVPFSGGEATYRATSVFALKSPIPKNSREDIAKGKDLYFTFCAQCHGKFHDGNGTVGQSFHPLPTNLRRSKIQQMADARMFKHISYGIPNGKQPPLATTITVLNRWRIIAYIKSLSVRN